MNKPWKTCKSLGFALLFFTINTLSIANEKYTNSLISEDSPYLQQHAHNPVDWFAWNDEAFLKAKNEKKLIFLSIGYSTCHWCHVMEKESFENEEVAKILNKYFVSIKVDREEMPHVDKYFQNIHNLVNKKSGGWPLNIILTPQRKAFFAATYLPFEKKHGRVGIKELLNDIQKDFQINHKKIYELSINIEDMLNDHKNSNNQKVDLELSLINKFISEVDNSFDHINYGIGTRPKFPHNSTIETLLDIYKTTKNEKALSLATSQLKAMANGGIYDQIEGGFYRYSVDEKWTIPHFEKMLYTNAELLSSYSKAYMITNDVFYKNIVDGIINFVSTRFEKENLLYSASDADSLNDEEKEEGAYFVFNQDEVIELLEEKKYLDKEIIKIIEYFNISFAGNFENGLSNPYLTNKELPDNIIKVKEDLRKLRSLKPYPFIDYKILTSWNAMYISSLFEAGKIEYNYSLKALELLDNLLEKLYINEKLYHQRLIDKKPKVDALFEDYAFLIDALLKAYDFSLDNKYLILATKLNSDAIEKFYKNETWFMSDDEFRLSAEIYDSAYRSSLSQMIENILKLAILKDNLELQQLAISSIEKNSYSVNKNPNKAAWFLRSYLAYKKEFILLKAPKKFLENKSFNDYVFFLRKANKELKYLACKLGVCFAYDDTFEVILDKIKEEITK